MKEKLGPQGGKTRPEDTVTQQSGQEAASNQSGEKRTKQPEVVRPSAVFR
jgi:hypothetical protein